MQVLRDWGIFYLLYNPIDRLLTATAITELHCQYESHRYAIIPFASLHSVPVTQSSIVDEPQAKEMDCFGISRGKSHHTLSCLRPRIFCPADELLVHNLTADSRESVVIVNIFLFLPEQTPQQDYRSRIRNGTG